MKKIKANSDKNATRELVNQIPLWIKREAKLPLPALRNLAQLWLFVFPGKKHEKDRMVLLLIAAWIIITDRFFESRKTSRTQLLIFCRDIDYCLKKPGHRQDDKKTLGKSMDFSIRLFAEIFQILSEQKADQRFLDQWKRSVRNFLKGMMNERNFSYAHPPLLRQYLENGRQSIGSNAVLYAVALLIFRKPRWLGSEKFGIINKIIKDSALLLRLINDLGSHKRESAHKILNGLAVLIKQGETAESSRKKISRLIDKKLAILKRRIKSAPLEFRPFFAALDKLLRFTLNLYETKDYHNESPRP
ncbi:hypothetical protein EPN15_04530 [Patescibacteria group bacterium]|nr:MAG: hypothetical protein EPN15_04530 [Patescibacteria group bacterium]